MELYLGGFSQGKLQYVLAGKGSATTIESLTGIPQDTLSVPVIFNRFHVWFYREMEQGRNPEEQMEAFLEHCPEVIIISDEVGNGIVPELPLEREYRERLGRYLCRVAKRAVRVERVVCGIGQRIK